MSRNAHLVPYMRSVYDSIATSRKLRSKEIESFEAWLMNISFLAAVAAEKVGAIPAIRNEQDLIDAIDYCAIQE